MPTTSAKRVVSMPSGVIRHRRVRVELNAPERGEQKQCLNEIHPNLVIAARTPILNGNQIRPPLAVKFDAGTQYMIRDLTRNTVAADEFAVGPSFFRHAGLPAIGGIVRGFNVESTIPNREAR